MDGGCSGEALACRRRRIVVGLLVGASATVAFASAASAQDGGVSSSSDGRPASPAPAIAAPLMVIADTTGVVAREAEGDAEEGGPTVVVSGYRRSIETSLMRKREAEAFVDVVTAEDIGKFPDKNVADSLQRVPGIVIDRDGGEGATVSIRGLRSDLTLTELNGNYVASAGTLSGSADPSRSFNYILLPANMLAQVEVYKSPEARLDEGGLGGVVELHTRQPLSLKPWSGFLSAEGTYADVTRKVEPSLGGQLSWHNEAGSVGLLLGATYQRRTDREMEGSTEGWQWWTDGGRESGKPATDVHGNTFANDDAVSYWSQNKGETTVGGAHFDGYWAPQSVDETVTVDRRTRLGVQATVEFMPTSNLHLTANYFRFQLRHRTLNNRIKIPEWGYDAGFFTGAKFDQSGTIMQSATFQLPPAGVGCLTATPICTMETPQIQDTVSDEKDLSSTYDAHLDWEQDRFKVSIVGGYTRATGGPSRQFHAAVKPRLTGNVTENGNELSAWDFSEGRLSEAFSPGLLANLENGIAQIDQGLPSTGSSYTNSAISQKYLQVDVSRHFGGIIEAITVGGKWREGAVRRTTGELDWYSDPATQTLFQDIPAGSYAPPGIFYGIGNLDRGFQTNVFPAIDMQKYIGYLNANYGPAIKVPQPLNRYDVKERIWAGYLQVDIRFSDGLRGNLGLRVARTTQSGTSTDTIYDNRDYCVDGPNGPFDSNVPLGGDGNCQVIPRSQRQTLTFSTNDQGKSYTSILPSMNLAWNATDRLLVRGAISKAIARPSFDDLGSARVLVFNEEPYAFDRKQFGERAGWFGSGGNFDLKPLSAWAYDLGIEWYFHPGSVGGVSLFRKDVRNFVVPVIADLAQTVQGKGVVVQQYSTAANGASAVSEGVEAYLQHTLDIGLGVQANFTFNHTSAAAVKLGGATLGSSPLVGSAKTQWNASVFYEKNAVLLRASFNRRGTQVGGLVSGLNVYNDPYQQVDLNGQYNLTRQISLTASIVNLTKETQTSHLGHDTKARFYSSQYTGRRFYAGMQWTF